MDGYGMGLVEWWSEKNEEKKVNVVGEADTIRGWEKSWQRCGLRRVCEGKIKERTSKKKNKHETKQYEGESKSANTPKSLCMEQLAGPPAAAWQTDLNASYWCSSSWKIKVPLQNIWSPGQLGAARSRWPYYKLGWHMIGLRDLVSGSHRCREGQEQMHLSLDVKCLG